MLMLLSMTFTTATEYSSVGLKKKQMTHHVNIYKKKRHSHRGTV